MEKRNPSNCVTACVARTVWLLALVSALGASARANSAVKLSESEALRIGRKVWQNECAGSITGLTSWNSGENFASLGIGHFIWYPQGVRGPFDESFPKFVAFAVDHGTTVPAWVREARPCPWNSRSEFNRAENSAQMKELRQFLAKTVDVQAHFLVARLNAALAKMLDEAPPTNRANVEQQFQRVAATPQGCYALVDYVNFKGEGVLATERYHNEGWGLLQVLQQMRGSDPGPAAVHEFSKAAASVLKRRVQNSPPERKESRWLPGWINRVSSYANS